MALPRSVFYINYLAFKRLHTPSLSCHRLPITYVLYPLHLLLLHLQRPLAVIVLLLNVHPLPSFHLPLCQILLLLEHVGLYLQALYGVSYRKSLLHFRALLFCRP